MMSPRLPILLALTTAPVAAQVPSRAVAVARIDSIATAMLNIPTAGFQVAVVKGRDTLVMKGYGMANIEHGVPVTPSTVFQIGSVTKQYTAAAIMRLVEQGKLSLDDQLSTHMPDVPAHWRTVTIRQLLNHTSGIPSFTDVGLGMRLRGVFITGTSRDSLVRLLHGDSLIFPPGWGFYYNNTGYYLLGMLIEKLAGKTYAAYIADDLAKPLGLERTMYCAPRPIIPGRAAGYSRAAGGGLTNASVIDMGVPYAAGALCSTARDMVKWAHALATGRVVTAESYRAMTTPVKVQWVRPMNYGFGLTVSTLGTHRVIEHGGNIDGFNAQLAHYPDDSLYIAVATNTSSASAGDLALHIARILLGVPAAPAALKDEPVTDAERAMLVGTYSVVGSNGTRREATLRDDHGRLVLDIPGLLANGRLQRQEGFVFAVQAQVPTKVLFDVRGGKVVGFVFDRALRPLPGYRLP